MFTLGSMLVRHAGAGSGYRVGILPERRRRRPLPIRPRGAAAAAAYLSAGGGSINCSVTNVACYATEYVCPSTLTTPANNIQAGCLYAQTTGSSPAGRQKVTFQSGAGTAATARALP